jgi:hypothetical protein
MSVMYEMRNISLQIYARKYFSNKIIQHLTKLLTMNMYEITNATPHNFYLKKNILKIISKIRSRLPHTDKILYS